MKMASEDVESKCLLTPTAHAHSNFSYTSDPDLLESVSGQRTPMSEASTTDSHVVPIEPIEADVVEAHLAQCPLIYSEPALIGALIESRLPLYAMSETALPKMCFRKGVDSQASNYGDELLPLEGDEKETAGDGRDTKQSMYMSDISVMTTTGPRHKTSFSTREVREQHAIMQQKYRQNTIKERKVTDPVDFEGILNIIGGCSWWQLWIYMVIAMQQIPHAMFNLNVVYMMFEPDHHCKIPALEDKNSSMYRWGLSEALMTDVVFPRAIGLNVTLPYSFSMCSRYDLSDERIDALRRMNLDDAIRSVRSERPPIVKCEYYTFRNEVMEETIVTDWNLVCDKYFMKGHAHLFYSFGFLIGCILSGLASDNFGRKPTIIGFGILSSMFGVLLPYSTYYPMFLFIRFCSAVCNEAADLAAYTLCMEITGRRYRAMVGSMLQVPWAMGYALLALVAYISKSWKAVQVLSAGLHFGAVLLVCSVPESPRWLMVKERVDEAEEVIRRACRHPPFPFNLCPRNRGSLPSDLELTCHREKRLNSKGKVGIATLFQTAEMRFRTIIICVVFMATALVYYGLVMALSDQSAPGRSLFTGNFFLNNAVAGAIEIPTLFFCVWLMRFGRKKAQMFLLVVGGVSIIAAMLAITYGSQMASLILLFVGKVFVQGAFNVLYIYTSELYPTVVRNLAVGITSMIARFGSGVSSYIALLSNISLPIVPMTIFAIFSLFAGALVSLLPETGENPLPETLDDAENFLKADHKPKCYGFTFRRRRAAMLRTRTASITEQPIVNNESSDESKKTLSDRIE